MRTKKEEVIQNTDTLMRRCGVCGWAWKKRMGADDPRRCPNDVCRSVRWKEPAEAGVGGSGKPPQGGVAAEVDGPKKIADAVGKTAAEVAAGIPGVGVGIPGPFVYAEDGPEEDVDIFDGPGPVDWDRLAKEWAEMDPGPIQEQIDEKLQERGKRRPKDWAKKSAAQRMEWLKNNA